MLPFLLKPYLKEVIWGGDGIAALKELEPYDFKVGESWEVSAMTGHESVVASGQMAGTDFADLCRRYGRELMGEETYKRFNGKFPLLVKFIDATRDLSVQVHPDDRLAAELHGKQGKSELWYVVDSKPGASIIPGFKKSLTPEEFDKHLAENTIIDTLARYETRPGDVFYIPSGRIHAAGAGNLILEIQQPSDITYRIYDYNRVDDNGNSRELHHDLARRAIKLDALEDYRIYPNGNEVHSGPFFNISKVEVEADKCYEVYSAGFTIVMALNGKLDVSCENETLGLSRGFTCFIPAKARTRVSGTGTVLLITV